MARGARPWPSSWANTADLNLPAAGIETDDRGNIKVDDRLRTSAD
ncbi:pyridine nucleotide-disulfide oxidoreductase [Lactobacillus delbrueckii subsp. delbrueckii DSM 20074 = JCM 1012]|nr:pyridine nucleotide-disulfide oxidoreductase [Lactobacillus delbrueckii subsp. delbrueckii DSM 20074 = JCM 1012]